MGSGAGKVILPLMSLAAAPMTGGASLAGLGGISGVGTAAGLANAGIGLLRDRSRARSEEAATAAEIQSTRTDKLLGELGLAEQRIEAEKRRARDLAAIANSGRSGASAKAGLAGAADRDNQAVFASLAGRQVALDSRARSRIAALRRRSRSGATDRAFGLLDDVRDIGGILNGASS
ncbi:hypothetical protein EOI86_07125 [Hwanghaeella grinnelliae]|uniref:Uncharacterized protein n=1 Tax=Hwanghaeella grinnelliae TaxID=2500179 RepID=A0A437QWX4_9PROT|nr:hypothetical protein [Hwanghaeella grinnelliae]RVU39022.1 hypothetical protein EOI86_07125 [Hwanghaeella grinnelliae]